MIRLRIGLCALAVAASLCPGLESRFSGSSSARIGARWDTAFAADGALRYIPALSLTHPLGPVLALDLEASLDARLIAAARSDSVGISAELAPYRAWVRLGADRFETRLGLQKLAFGSALLLRPLQWFDRIDPRDPTASTGGVWGALGRYWFSGNANLWAWGLLGNAGTRPWQAFDGARWVPEAGARLQVPVPRGEAALSFHHRTALDMVGGHIPEDRLGIDAKLDVGIGLWAEATLLHEWDSRLSRPWQSAACLGLDYTFGIGNGLTVTAEHLGLARTVQPLRSSGAVAGNITALSLAYPLGLLDRLSGFALYDWHNRDVYAFAAWQRTLDRWTFQAAGLWGPGKPAAAGAIPGAAAGKGISLSVVFNH